MKEIRPLGLAHLPNGLESNWRTGCGFTSSDLNFKGFNWNDGTPTVGIAIQDGKLVWKSVRIADGNLTPGLPARGISFLAWSELLGGSRKGVQNLVFGFRFKQLMANPSASLAVLGLSFVIPTADGSMGTNQPLFDLGAAGAFKAEGYYEIEIVPYAVAGQGISIWLDGIKISTVAISNDLRFGPDAIANTPLVFGNTQNQSIGQGSGGFTETLWSMEDIYAAWTDEPGVSMRQGPIKVRQLPVASINTAAWTSSDGSKTPLEVLNLPNHSGTTLTPTVNSDVDNTPLRVKPNVSGLKSTDKILGVFGGVSARRDVGAASSLSMKWASGSNESAAVSGSPTNGTWDLQKDFKLPNLVTMPGGATLTKAALADLELVITPNG